MAKRKATKNEIAKTERNRRKTAGVTKSGLPRGYNKKKPSTLEIQEEAIRQPTKASDIASQEMGQGYEEEQREISGRTTSLSEDAPGPTSAAALVESGAYLDPAGSAAGRDIWEPGTKLTPKEKEIIENTRVNLDQFDEWKKQNLGNRKVTTTAAEERAGRRVQARTAADRRAQLIRSVKPSVDLTTGQVTPPSRPLTVAEAKARQAAFTGEPGRVRTANPPGQRVINTDRKTGEPVINTVPRPNPLTVRSVARTVDAPLRRAAGEAESALAGAEARLAVERAKKGKMVSGPESDARTFATTTPSGDVRFVTSTDREMSVSEALNDPSIREGLTKEQRQALDLEKRDIGKTRQTRIGKNVVGRADVSADGTPIEEFAKNVASLRKRADESPQQPVTSETPLVTGYGAPLKDVTDSPQFDRILGRVQGFKSRRTEITDSPRSMPKDYQRSKPAAPLTGSVGGDTAGALEGANDTERLRSALAKQPNPVARREMLSQLGAASRGSGEVTEPLTKRTEDPETRSRVNRTWIPYASANKALSRAAGRDIGSQTGDEADEVLFAIEEGTRRFIESDLMSAPSKSTASPSSLFLRAPDARRLNRGVDQTWINRQGQGELTDDQMAVARARGKGKTVEWWDKTPGAAGGMTIVTSQGQFGKLAGSEGEIEYGPAKTTSGKTVSTIQDRGKREEILARMWKQPSVIADSSTGGTMEAPGVYSKTRRVVPEPKTWEKPKTGMFSEKSDKVALAKSPANKEAEQASKKRAALSRTPSGREQQAAGTAKAAEDKRYLKELDEKSRMGSPERKYPLFSQPAPASNWAPGLQQAQDRRMDMLRQETEKRNAAVSSRYLVDKKGNVMGSIRRLEPSAEARLTAKLGPQFGPAAAMGVKLASGAISRAIESA